MPCSLAWKMKEGCRSRIKTVWQTATTSPLNQFVIPKKQSFDKAEHWKRTSVCCCTLSSHHTQIQCDTTFTQSVCDRMLQLKQCLIYWNIFHSVCVRCHCYCFKSAAIIRVFLSICTIQEVFQLLYEHMSLHGVDTWCVCIWCTRGHVPSIYMTLACSTKDLFVFVLVTYRALNWNKRDWGACSLLVQPFCSLMEAVLRTLARAKSGLHRAFVIRAGSLLPEKLLSSVRRE